MYCFTHPNEAAVGICKSCGKGVCRGCAIEVDRGLACSERCKAFTEALSRLQVASIRNIGVVSAQRIVHPLFALLFLGMAVYFSSFRADVWAWYLYAFGAIFAVTSLVTWLRPAASPRKLK
ncbi:MAG TPA: hypothetical protein VFB32_05760 [Rudaea sp.]|nr:hypothetical protein [Rudaea sp.]